MGNRVHKISSHDGRVLSLIRRLEVWEADINPTKTNRPTNRPLA